MNHLEHAEKAYIALPAHHFYIIAQELVNSPSFKKAERRWSETCGIIAVDGLDDPA